MIMAENKRYYWLKLKDDYFTSPKIRKLRKIAGGDTLTIIYLKMQLLTVKSEGTYEYQHIENSLVEELALILDEDIDNVKLTLAFLQAQDLVSFNEESNELSLYEAMGNIGSECESAERVRLYRERDKERKLLQCNDSVTQVKPSSNISNSTSQSKSLIEEETSSKCTNKRFVKPTLEEVQEYCKERNNNIDAQYFIDYYESNGWKVGKNAMKDWKAAVRTWEKNDFGKGKAKQTKTKSPYDDILKATIV